MSDQGSNGSAAGLSSEELRLAIRAVLRDVLPPVAGSTANEVEQVTLRTDTDLDLFVRRLASMCEDSSRRQALREGRLRFRLTSGGPVETPTPSLAGAAIRVDRGAVTERRVKQASAEGARLVVGRRAVLTPLARDRARALGVIVEKEH